MRSFEEYYCWSSKINIEETHFEIRVGVGQTLEEELNILQEYLAPFLCNG